jgi:hypothetical protein
MSHLHETSAIKISYPDLNVVSMIVRVAMIDRGSLSEGGCTLEVIEDVFGTAYTVYGSPPAAGAAPAAEELGTQYSDLDGSSTLVFTTGPTYLTDENNVPLLDENGNALTE